MPRHWQPGTPVKLVKMGHALTLRIPAAICEHFDLEKGQKVDVEVVEVEQGDDHVHRIMLTPRPKPQ